MLTSEKFIRMINSLGMDASSFDIDSFLLANATHTLFYHSESNVIDAVTHTYKLDGRNLIFSKTQAFSADKTALSTLTTEDNVATAELFDHTDVSFVQTAFIAIDPSEGIYRLLEPVSDAVVLAISSMVVDEAQVTNSLAFAQDIANPITSFKKGPIEVRVKPLTELLAAQQKLDAINGKTIKSITATRYSNGRVRGRGRGV